MIMWVTQCIFLRSSTFHHVNLGKLQFSCLDTRFTKVSTRFVKQVFKLDVDIFHQRQPNCKLYSYERATKKENSTISSWDWGRYRSEEMAPGVCAWGQLTQGSVREPDAAHIAAQCEVKKRSWHEVLLVKVSSKLGATTTAFIQLSEKNFRQSSATSRTGNQRWTRALFS